MGPEEGYGVWTVRERTTGPRIGIKGARRHEEGVCSHTEGVKKVQKRVCSKRVTPYGTVGISFDIRVCVCTSVCECTYVCMSRGRSGGMGRDKEESTVDSQRTYGLPKYYYIK